MWRTASRVRWTCRQSAVRRVVGRQRDFRGDKREQNSISDVGQRRSVWSKEYGGGRNGRWEPKGTRDTLDACLRSAPQGNRRQGLQDLVRRGRVGRVEGGQAPSLCADPFRARLGEPSL